MEVYVRDVCLKCGGTGKNQMSDKAAKEEATMTYLKFDPEPKVMRLNPKPFIKVIARGLQVCGYCKNGYNTRWISLNKLLSSGMQSSL